MREVTNDERVVNAQQYSIKNVAAFSLLYNRKKTFSLRIVLAVVFILLLLPSYALYPIIHFNAIYSAYASLNQTSAYPVQFWAITCGGDYDLLRDYIISYFCPEFRAVAGTAIKGRNILFIRNC